MLLLPFVVASILTRAWHWSLLAALLAVATVFVIRQPLIVLARQRYVWKSVHAETAEARRWVLGLSGIAAVCGVALLWRWPLNILVSMAIGAAAMTLLAVGATVQNRQRSIALQIASATGLTASSLAAATSSCGALPDWTFWLWGALALQSTAGILLVHARLDARIRLRKPDAVVERPSAAIIAQGFMLLAAVTLATRQEWWLAAAMALPGILNGYQLSNLEKTESLNTPLTSVGLRAMALSITVAILLSFGLWPRAGC
jgi:hypothetical protein